MKTILTLLLAFGCVGARAGVTLQDYKLTGTLAGDTAAFTLTGSARVADARGGSLELLAGPLAFTALVPNQRYRLEADEDRFIARFDRPGTFPIEIHFNALVTKSNEWSAVNFRTATSALQPVVLQGLAANTEFQLSGATRPERSGTNFVSFLPGDGTVSFAWKSAAPEAGGKLFYSAEMLSQISVSPDLMRQSALLNGKIMQGEMSRLALKLQGAGEVTRVQGDEVLAWNVEGGTNSGARELVVQFNQPQKDAFAILVQMQTPLDAFPQTADAVRLEPENATRFAGFVRLVNEGAVRLEVLSAGGLSQISPEQFPETGIFPATGSQRFAYRFSSADFALRLQADQILPEVGVSEVLAYNLGDNELSVDAELELDIREAPLRELWLNIPRGYAVAKLNAAGLSDYFTGDSSDPASTELRLVYAQPVADRQIVQLRLERNQSLTGTNWALPRVEVVRAKSVRGFVGVSADNGFRLAPERTQALTEIATAFFPQPLAGIQSAFRLSDAAWQASLRVERLPQTVQADAFHLFSIGEGIAYGSSVINYLVSGSPVAAFRVELSDEYFNVEFTGKDIRNWEKTTNGWLVQLHTPVSGAYTLLATYERPFQSKGETLAFTGARPLDAQGESGHTIVISAYQFQVKPVEVSAGLLPLEPGEVPPEYRLFFDQPVLAAYRYSARPFSLKLALSPLAQGDSLAQVVDRAALSTRISKEGQAITEARYFVKSRGNPNFSVTLPPGTSLWAATVNDHPVVPVTDGVTNLIPLPAHADPDTVLAIHLELASHATDATRLALATPTLAAPVMLAQWELQPDEGRRLQFVGGSLTPVNAPGDASGFAQMNRAVSGFEGRRFVSAAVLALGFLFFAALLWLWASAAEVDRYSARHLLGSTFWGGALVLAACAFGQLFSTLETLPASAPPALTFLAPVQPGGTGLAVQVANLPAAAHHGFGRAWPLLLAAGFWLFAGQRADRAAKSVWSVLGWLMASWAALRLPNGGSAFLALLAIFLCVYVVGPALGRIFRVRAQPAPRRPPQTPPPVVAALLLGGFWLASLTAAHAGTLPASVDHQVRVADGFVSGTARIHWQAGQGETLPVLFEPAVLTHVNFPKALRLEPAPAGSQNAQQLVARAKGAFDIEVQYQLPVLHQDDDSGFTLPLPSGLINRATLSLSNLDVDVYSARAVSVRRTASGSNTVATLTLSPGSARIGWKPRSRDVKNEKSVFYADLSQLYVPSAGVVEGIHQVAIRPAQGELTALTFTIPAGATVTDVTDGSHAGPGDPSLVSLWRFDPDRRQLRVTLSPAQFRPFTLSIRSQVAAGTLPYSRSVGLVSVDGAAGQIGLLGIATANDVQLDDVVSEKFSAINLEDFPAAATQPLAAQFPGLTVRRAFRYADPQASAQLKASAVEPDVRVETQDTLSLGEDRTVLATAADVTITRAGIFKLSFNLPPGFAVESISGDALSHWTEVKTGSGRLITLNLVGKTEGRQQFILSLAGPGLKTARGWAVPRVAFREAGKQRGTLLVVPEQGMRLEAAARDGVTQLDPQKSGVRQKGVLAFRILETSWNLALDIEQVDPWIQVTSLQHTIVNDAQAKVAANLQYQIENTGLKSFRVFLPANAAGVSFQGEQLADFVAVDGDITNGLQAWDVRLHRRVIGQYLLQVNYRAPNPPASRLTVLRGVVAADVNLQRGFATVESAGRLQIRIPALPSALQTAEWQAIPRTLQKDLSTASANYSFRLTEPDFQLPLELQRHEAAQLLPAHVTGAAFTSVVSDTGEMLTQVRLEIIPGDLRLLHLSLPAGAQFWFAFVDQNGAWPWRDGGNLLIPLEQQSRRDQSIPVEIFFSCQAGRPGSSALDLTLAAPKFELPLENLTWRVFLNDKWQVKKWNGALQLQQQEVAANGALDLGSYLQNESSWKASKTKQAEEMLAAGNTALKNGDPQSARRAFESAFGLSTSDEAFNEDARVQLNNLKLQQALMGLSVRQAAVAGQLSGTDKLNELRNNREANYTQEDAKQVIDNNSADENAAWMKLAGRLIQQQDAAAANPAVIRANLPEQGRLLTFKRAIVVDTWADLKINLQTRAPKAVSLGLRLGILALAALFFTAFALLARAWAKTPAER